MGDSVTAWFKARAAAMLALALPCLAGLTYLIAAGAPSHYVTVNAGALAFGLAMITIGPIQIGVLSNIKARRVLCVTLIALMALPIVAGPSINGVSRWLSVGGLNLHIGMVTVPLLMCLAARDRDYAIPITLSAILISLMQPGAASAFALMLAAVGFYYAWDDWKAGVAAITGFMVGVFASLRGELPAQPFVERILADVVAVQPFLAIAMVLSLFVSFFLMLHFIPHSKAERFAMAGTFAGFSIAAFLSNYPHILIGYGAAPILGYGLALSARPRSAA